MDYFPEPHECSVGIEVPLVDHIPPEFNVDDFDRFAEEQGIYLPDGSFDAEQSPSRLATVLQSYFFFGLVQCLFAELVDIQEWKAKSILSPAIQVVTWPERFKAMIKKTPKPDENTLKIMKKANEICGEVDKTSFAFQTPLAEILLSIRLLCEVIFKQHKIRPNEWTAFGNRFLATELLRNYWCPTRIDPLLDDSFFGVVSGYYLLTLHRTTFERLDHSSCSDGRCTISNSGLHVDYQTRHVTLSCQCPFVGVCTEELCAIIESGEVPLIIISLTGGKVSLSVKAAGGLDKYVAISHVWADGLGNPHSNALPECQLRRLGGQMGVLPSLFRLEGNAIEGIAKEIFMRRRLLWLDTLCIPVGSTANVVKARAKAIDRMNITYAAADQVLVLDAGVMESDTNGNAAVESAARIALSRWMTRSWTFQEGFLARECYFQGSKYPFDPKKKVVLSIIGREALVKRLTRAVLTLSPSPLRGTHRDHHAANYEVTDELAYSIYHSFLDIIQPALDPFTSISQRFDDLGIAIPRTQSSRFVAIWNALTRRSTTMPDDLYLIFANMLDYSAYQIMALPNEQRMQSVLQTMQKLPLQLLFNHGLNSKYGHDRRNRWIPLAASTTELCECRLCRSETFQFQQGRTWIESEDISGTSMLLVQPLPPVEKLYIRRGDQGYYEIASEQLGLDLFDENDFVGVCFLVKHGAGIRKRSSLRTSGARLLLRGTASEAVGIDTSAPSSIISTADTPDQSGNKSRYSQDHIFDFSSGFESSSESRCESSDLSRVSIRAHYDCPVHIQWIPIEAHVNPDEIVINGDDVGLRCLEDDTVPWELDIDCDSSTLTNVLSKRPTPRASNLLMIGCYCCWGLFVAPIAFSSVALRFKIAFDTGWTGTSWMHKASLILLIGSFPFAVLMPISYAAFYIDRFQMNSANAWDKACLAFFLVSAACLPLILLNVVGIETLVYRAWLETFTEKWPAQQSWAYRLTLGKPLEIFVRAKLTADAFEKKFQNFEDSFVNVLLKCKAWMSGKISSVPPFRKDTNERNSDSHTVQMRLSTSPAVRDWIQRAWGNRSVAQQEEEYEDGALVDLEPAAERSNSYKYLALGHQEEEFRSRDHTRRPFKRNSGDRSFSALETLFRLPAKVTDSAVNMAESIARWPQHWRQRRERSGAIRLE